jgi:hypothetical protein
MKRTLTGMLALLAGAYVVHAQGYVSFANYAVANTYLYVGFKVSTTTHLLGGSNVGPAPTMGNYAAEIQNGNDWSVELYGAAGAGLPSSELVPLGSSATFANGVNDKVAGTWASSAAIYIPGTSTASPVATVQLYAWYNDGGAITSIAQAFADGVPVGESSLANVTVTFLPYQPAELPFAALAYDDGFDGFDFFTSPTLTPEPSTIWLGVLGATALVMRLRRKN